MQQCEQEPTQLMASSIGSGKEGGGGQYQHGSLYCKKRLPGYNLVEHSTSLIEQSLFILLKAVANTLFVAS